MAIKSGFDFEVVLMNPQNEIKGFSNIGFYEFCITVVNTNTFTNWADENNVSAWINKDELKINQKLVEKFLKYKGYNIIKKGKV